MVKFNNKEEIIEEINKIKNNIVNLKDIYKEIIKEYNNIKTRRIINHVIIFLTFFVSVIINNLINIELSFPFIGNEKILWNILKLITFSIPYISFISYEVKTRDEKKILKKLEIEKYIVNRNIATENFFLKVYSEKLNKINSSEPKVIFSKHDCLNLENEDVKSNEFVKKLK